MKFRIEPWAPEYGSSFDPDALQPPSAQVEVGLEVAPADWGPRPPAPGVAAAPTVLFVDGVRRIDARVWIDGAEGTHAGICASYAAGVVRCDGAARVIAAEVRRGFFSAAHVADAIRTAHGDYPHRPAAGETIETLSEALQEQMGDLEVVVAHATGSGDLLVVDGPLRGRQNIDGAIGYIKSHHVPYLSDELRGVVSMLAPGERTPLFYMTTSWSRWSWYLRLPGASSVGWSGIVRCEASSSLSRLEAAAKADVVAATVPRYASALHKDPRAPQNLYPIAALERELRRRLGDAGLLHRQLLLSAFRGR